MELFVHRLEKHFTNDDDFFVLNDYLAGKPVVFIGFDSLVDMVRTKHSLQTYAQTLKVTGVNEFKTVLGHVVDIDHMEEALSAIIEGKLIIYFDNDASYVIMNPTSQELDRAVETPINENVLQGTITSFTDNININIGILRKQVHTDKIRVRTYTVGSRETTQIHLIYYEGRADMNLVRKIKKQIEKNKDQQIDNLQQLSSKLMGFRSLNMIANYNQTELPQEAANFLRQGRAILFIDRLPLAIVLPNLLWDVFILDSDKNFPLPIMIFQRLLRVIGVLLTLVLPGMYVALVSVNPEVLRIELALSIAQTREGIPYPALVEIIIMLIILELIIEASIRLPKNIGPTITMVGGIILGQAVVQAKLVSNLLIIILAGTTIANSTIVGLQQSFALRISKYVIVILASIYGIFGIMAGLVLVFAYLSGLSTFGIPYTGFMRIKEEVSNG
ncbi:spore germination protein [Paenibacillus sp. sgz500958]|uniref:spore germination protein n=1 Tax=Paenibacillus sp. sgz500958 TaxID=3242475 RepID=UPI0036D39E71